MGGRKARKVSRSPIPLGPWAAWADITSSSPARLIRLASITAAGDAEQQDPVLPHSDELTSSIGQVVRGKLAKVDRKLAMIDGRNVGAVLKPGFMVAPVFDLTGCQLRRIGRKLPGRKSRIRKAVGLPSPRMIRRPPGSS
jgi:hypothetical protein